MLTLEEKEGKCSRQREAWVQRSCGRREADVLQENKGASTLGLSDQEGRLEKVRPRRWCRAWQGRAQHMALRW